MSNNLLLLASSSVKIHTCDVCGELFAWSSGSRVFGSIGHADCGARQFLVCSQRCLANAPSNSQIEHIIGAYQSRRMGIVVGSHWAEWDNRKGASQ